MPRLVRQRPWAERLKDHLNPYDLWIRISEELDTSDHDWDQWAYVAGVACNFVFMLARANSTFTPYDDVFADDEGGGLFRATAAFFTYSLIIASASNAFFTFARKRHYRLFERPVEGAPPSTPSARRVRVDSSPVSSTPFRFISSLFGMDSARSRAHADATREVWELAVWDPLTVNLKFLCTFSPGHALLYWLFIPVSPTDPRPSTTNATAMFLAALLSLQLILMQHSFGQQIKDNAYIHKEVMNEYDTKYVHPRTQPTMRDVGVQFDEENTTLNTVELYTPVTIINRGFKPNPNPNYVGLVDPDHGLGETPTRPPKNFAGLAHPNGFSPSPAAARLPRANGVDVGTGGDGYLGVFTHARSPLKTSQTAAGRLSTGPGLHNRARQSIGTNGVPAPRYPR